MEKIIFSENNIYILSKLVTLLRREHGSRHRLSSEESVNKLLIEASHSRQKDIKQLFSRFLENLHPSHVQSYKAKGVKIPKEFDRDAGFMPPPISRQYAFTGQ